MSQIPNDKTAPRTRARARTIAGARLAGETEDQARVRLERELSKVATTLRQTIKELRAELTAARAGFRRQRAARQVDASAMGDALTALINAANQIDAWLDAAGPLRQQLADAISAQQNLLEADAKAAQVESGADERAFDRDALAAGLRAVVSGARRGR